LKIPGKYRNPARARGVAAWLILETKRAKLVELSAYTGRDVSTLSSAAKALHVRAQGDQGLADTMMELMEGLCGIAITKA